MNFFPLIIPLSQIHYTSLEFLQTYEYDAYFPTSYVLNYSYPYWIPPLFWCGWRACTYYNIGGFLLEAEAIWGHTCIAGGLFLLLIQ